MTTKEKIAAIKKILFNADPAQPEQKFMDAALEDGTPIQIHGEAPAEGVKVTLADGTPVPDAEHTLADGTKITTVGGAITAVAPAEAAPEEMGEDTKNQIEQLKTGIADLLTKFEAQGKEIEKLKTANAAHEQKFTAHKEAIGQTLELAEMLVAEPKEPKHEPKKQPFGIQKPDPNEKLTQLAETLQNMKQANEA
jgi:hypothetical protein